MQALECQCLRTLVICERLIRPVIMEVRNSTGPLEVMGLLIGFLGSRRYMDNHGNPVANTRTNRLLTRPGSPMARRVRVRPCLRPWTSSGSDFGPGRITLRVRSGPECLAARPYLLDRAFRPSCSPKGEVQLHDGIRSKAFG